MEGDEMNKEMKIDELTTRIEQWAVEKKLHVADPTKQVLKLAEEFGELCEGMVKGKQDQIFDSIGDMFVVLTILAMQLGISIDNCVGMAYEEIKDRQGKMINGVFVKEEDIINAHLEYGSAKSLEAELVGDQDD